MKEITDELININFEELNTLKLKFNKKIGLTIYWDNVKYEFILNLKKNTDKLLILGSGALGFRKFDRTRPYIERHSWHFKQSTIHYHDPTYYIDDKITGGWCIGTPDSYYLEKISNILSILIKKIKIPNSNVLFYGSSAGGFASLILSTLIKGTMALADIPQIYVNKYKSKEKQLDGWRNIKEICFGELTDNEFMETYLYRMDFIEMIKRENYVPNAYLVLDCSVKLDFDTQYIPFFNELNKIPFNENSNTIKLIIMGRNKGHNPLSQNDTFELIDRVFSESNDEIKNQMKNNFSGINNVNIESIIDRLNKYNTGRIDLIIDGENTKLELMSIDDYINIIKPHWLNNPNSSGLSITNKNNSIDLKVKCYGEGNLNIKLRGVHYIVNNQQIPIYINYTKFLINGENILNDNKIVFHNTPFIFNKKVTNEEIIKIHVEWTPC